MQATRSSKNIGFTIVELLIVIVVIGILAAISIVSYSGVSKQAVVTTIKSDLDGSRKQIEMFEIEKGVYPETIDCSQPITEKNTCLPLSGGNVVSYYRAIDNGATKSYYLTITNGANSYNITNSTPIEVGVIKPEAHTTKSCPPNYVMVPGNGALGTPNDFCVMKYEAKKDSAIDVGTVKSVPEGLPIVGSSLLGQSDMVKMAANSCMNGCRLISEAEWSTIANNIFYVRDNWSSGIVGEGYIYSGHNDNSPNLLLEADDDDNPYFGTDNSIDDGKSQKRTLSLSTGGIIWDFAGNAEEYTSGVTTQQPGLIGDVNNNWGYEREWNIKDLLYGELSPFAIPPSGYNSSNGIGKIRSVFANYGQEMSYIRGGAMDSRQAAGIYGLRFMSIGQTFKTIGFRVTCDPF